MPRTAGQMASGQKPMPPPGTYRCECIAVQTVEAKTGTPGVEVTWRVKRDGQEFSDSLWLSAGAMGRLAMFATRVCGMARDVALPDNDDEAVAMLADWITGHAENQRADVTVVEQIRRDGKGKDRRVRFDGYQGVPQEPEPQDPGEAAPPQDVADEAADLAASKGVPEGEKSGENLPF